MLLQNFDSGKIGRCQFIKSFFLFPSSTMDERSRILKSLVNLRAGESRYLLSLIIFIILSLINRTFHTEFYHYNYKPKNLKIDSFGY